MTNTEHRERRRFKSHIQARRSEPLMWKIEDEKKKQTNKKKRSFHCSKT